MMQITTLCDHETYDQTGAATVAIVFLAVFVALIFGDAVVTGFALNKALTKDEREVELNARITNKEIYLKQLLEGIADAQQGASYVRTQPTIPVAPGFLVGGRLQGAGRGMRALSSSPLSR